MPFADALQQMTGLLDLQARAKGLQFEADLGVLPAVVRADDKRLRQILFNVLGNAIKFTARGRVTLRVRYAREIAQFEIEDTGPGIAAADVERIFEPFARASDAAQGPIAGTGLGLTISKMLTELMGGEMQVRSTPGQGSTFRIRLYLPRLDASQGPFVEPPRHRIGYRGPRLRLLVVDHEAVDRELVAHRLAPLGFDVLQAPSGEVALALLQALAPEARPHAVLLDLSMAGIDGWTTLRALRERGLSEAPVAIVSANAFEKAAPRPPSAPPADFLLKPLRLDELLDWLGTRLGVEWVEAAPRPMAARAAPQDLTLPPPVALAGLAAVVDTGHVRGIHQALDQLERTHAPAAAFLAQARALARGFQLDALAALLQQALADATPSPHPSAPLHDAA